MFPSASKLTLAIKCPGSAMLPPLQGRTSNPAAERGTNLHKCMEESLLGGLSSGVAWAGKLGIVEDWNMAKERIPEKVMEYITSRGNLNVSHCMPEFSWGLKMKNEALSTEWYGTGLNRQYPEGFHGFVGTSDLMVLDPGTAEIWDWKSGQSKVEHPSDNYQFLVAALWAWLTGHTKVTAHVWMIDQDRTMSHAFSDAELSGCMAKLLMLAKTLTERIFIGNVGDHCKWCNASSYCPKLAETTEPNHDMVARAYALKQKAKAAEDDLRRVAMTHDEVVVSQETGLEYGVRRSSVEALDAMKTLAILGQESDVETALAAADIKFTKAGIKRAYGKGHAALIGKLRDGGAIARKERVTYGFRTKDGEEESE